MNSLVYILMQAYTCKRIYYTYDAEFEVESFPTMLYAFPVMLMMFPVMLIFVSCYVK